MLNSVDRCLSYQETTKANDVHSDNFFRAVCFPCAGFGIKLCQQANMLVKLWHKAAIKHRSNVYSKAAFCKWKKTVNGRLMALCQQLVLFFPDWRTQTFHYALPVRVDFLHERMFPCCSPCHVPPAGHGKNHKDAASVRATHPIPAACGIYYFEVKIVSKGRDG